MTQREQLLAIMAELGLNQSGFAKWAKINQRTVEHWLASPEAGSWRQCPTWYIVALNRLVEFYKSTQKPLDIPGKADQGGY